VLRRLSKIGVPHVIFTGGEPTLVEGLAELIRTAAGLGLVAGLNTNGRRLCERPFAASLREAGLDHVQITLESHRPEVHNAMTGANSFDETVRGIQNALDVGLHTLTNTTLTLQNIGHANESVEHLHGLGLRVFAMNGMIRAGGGCTSGEAVPVEVLAPVLARVRDRAAELGMRFLWYTPTEYCRLSPVELELGPRRCNAGEYSICIEPNGDVLPCQSYYTPVGNILHDPWQRIWQSELFLGFRRRVADPQGAGLPERCWQCPDLPLCAGGCKLERMRDEG
jgi:radical SAM protein with 4Fe4S-binding SPASM domain